MLNALRILFGWDKEQSIKTMSSFQRKAQTKMTLQFYYDFMSQPSRALHIILRLSGTQFQDCPVALFSLKHFNEDFNSNINRFGKVPCIIDDGFKLAESVAILRYLAAKHKILPQFYPQDFMSQARVDEFLEWQHINLCVACAHFYRTIWLRPLLGGKWPTNEKIAILTMKLERHLDIFEQIWLEKSDFLTGNTMTAADIFAACEIEQIRLADYDVRIKYPKIQKWLKRVRQNCNPHYDEAHQGVYKISGSGPNAKL